MPYTRKPNIRLVIPDSDFDLLISALIGNADPENNLPGVADGAGALYDKLMKYSRPYTDEDGTNLVDMRFFPNEASEMILALFSPAWKKLLNFCVFTNTKKLLWPYNLNYIVVINFSDNSIGDE